MILRCHCGHDRFEEFRIIESKGAVVTFASEWRCSKCGTALAPRKPSPNQRLEDSQTDKEKESLPVRWQP